jgi:virginiamycin B lyase
MSRFPPFSEDALEQRLREYYQEREAPIPPFERSWAALKTALDAQPDAQPGARPARGHLNGVVEGALEGVDEDEAAFILEDTLEDTPEDTPEDPMPGDEHTRPTTTVPSPRMERPRRGLSPRVTAIAAIAAVLLLVIIAATIFTQLAVRRTPHPAATPTPSAITKIALPNANQRSISALAPAPDGSLWYADSFGHSGKIGHLTSDGTLSEFPLPARETVKVVYIYSVIIGPDGALWFSGDDFDGSIYTPFVRRMTTNGAVTEVALPKNASPYWLLAGPDGAIWFAEETDKTKIGKIAADGHITEFPTLSQGKDGRILGLCVGPDQAIWYTWYAPASDAATLTGHIGRITPSGEVQEFTALHSAASIISGPDGTLWYSEYVPVSAGQPAVAPRKGYIGRITTAGVASELPIDPNVSVDRIVGRVDGAIWFISGLDDSGAYRRFGRITPSGDVKTFTPAEGTGIDVAVAAPGVLWILDDAKVIWRYRLPS